jgi:hypothetical protein
MHPSGILDERSCSLFRLLEIASTDYGSLYEQLAHCAHRQEDVVVFRVNDPDIASHFRSNVGWFNGRIADFVRGNSHRAFTWSVAVMKVQFASPGLDIDLGECLTTKNQGL